MSSKDPEKERWVRHISADIDDLSDLVGKYMRNTETAHKEDGSKIEVERETENYPEEISETIQALAQRVLCDLKELSGDEDSGEETDVLKDAYELIMKVLAQKLPCFGIDSWNDEICEQANCEIRFGCYGTRSFNNLNMEQKRQWVLDQIKKGIGCN
jgi:hypothetical protein